MRRSQMILEYVLPCSPNKNADSVSYGAEQCITQRVTPSMESVGGAPSMLVTPNAKLLRVEFHLEGTHEEVCIGCHTWAGSSSLYFNDNFGLGKGKTLYLPDSHLPRRHVHPTAGHQRF